MRLTSGRFDSARHDITGDHPDGERRWCEEGDLCVLCATNTVRISCLRIPLPIQCLHGLNLSVLYPLLSLEIISVSLIDPGTPMYMASICLPLSNSSLTNDP